MKIGPRKVDSSYSRAMVDKLTRTHMCLCGGTAVFRASRIVATGVCPVLLIYVMRYVSCLVSG